MTCNIPFNYSIEKGVEENLIDIICSNCKIVCPWYCANELLYCGRAKERCIKMTSGSQIEKQAGSLGTTSQVETRLNALWYDFCNPIMNSATVSDEYIHFRNDVLLEDDLFDSNGSVKISNDCEAVLKVKEIVLEEMCEIFRSFNTWYGILPILNEIKGNCCDYALYQAVSSGCSLLDGLPISDYAIPHLSELVSLKHRRRAFIVYRAYDQLILQVLRKNQTAWNLPDFVPYPVLMRFYFWYTCWKIPRPSNLMDFGKPLVDSLQLCYKLMDEVKDRCQSLLIKHDRTAADINQQLSEFVQKLQIPQLATTFSGSLLRDREFISSCEPIMNLFSRTFLVDLHGTFVKTEKGNVKDPPNAATVILPDAPSFNRVIECLFRYFNVSTNHNLAQKLLGMKVEDVELASGFTLKRKGKKAHVWKRLRDELKLKLKGDNTLMIKNET